MDGFGTSDMYEHALDRDSVYVRELTTTDSHAKNNLYNYLDSDFLPQDFYDLDDQVKKMIEHSLSYLHDEQYTVQNKVIMAGYSATGTFTDRFSTLHPETVAMVISGATLDDMLLPLTEYAGEQLDYPVGVADYEAIVGKPFDLTAHNQVARLIFMGKDDTNNVVGFSDCYYEYTNEQLTRYSVYQSCQEHKKA